MAIIVPIISEWNPKGLDKSLTDIKRAEGGWSKTGAAFKSAFLPAVGVVAGITLAAKGWITEAEDARQSTRRLEAVFKSMGDTTGAAAKQAEAYATALGNKIGVDDDDIKVTQAKLATFAAVSSAIGRQAGIFDRATAAAHDLAAAGFGDAAGNAVQLGKALQDPTKGITALARSGVTFTAAEKEKIKALTASGHLLDAQKIVLGAVEHQVGGVAAATATSSQKMAVSWANVQEALGTVLLPAFDKLAAILAVIATWVQENSTVVIILVGVIGALAAVVIAVNVAMKLYQTVTILVTAAQWAWNAAVTANPIGLLIVLIVALVAAVIVAVVLIVKHWDKVQAALVAVWNWIKSVFGKVWDWIGDKVGAVTDAIIGAWQKVWDFIKGIFDKIKGVWDSIGGIISSIGGIFGGLSASPAITASAAYTTTYTPTALGSTRTGGGGTPGAVVNVYGALDPESVARQVRALLIDHDVRQGRTPVRRVAW